MKKTNGITLIALILTIIVLLILAGVAISMLINNGIINKAMLAKQKYNNSQIEEENQLKILTNEIDSVIGSREQITVDKEEYTTLKNIVYELKNKIDNNNILIWNGIANTQETNYNLNYKDSNNTQRYDCMDFNYILLYYTLDDGKSRGTMLIPTEKIIKGSDGTWELDAYSTRYTSFYFLDNSFYVKTMRGDMSIYITSLYGINI